MEIKDLWNGYEYDVDTQELITPDWARHSAPIIDAPEVQEWLQEIEDTKNKAK